MTTAQIRLQRLRDEYGRFSKAAGLRTQQERAQVAGFGRGQAARATAAAAASDKRQWEDLRKTVGKNAPETLEAFTEIKYTDAKGWRKLTENKRLFEKIDSTATYTPEYREKLKQTYQYFLDAGFEFREHALNRVLGQKSSKGKFSFSNEQLLEILKKDANYRQEDGKPIRFYEGIAVVSASDTGEIVSVVVRNSMRKDWESL